MLRKLHDLKGFTVQGKKEKLGEIDDFYFDQDHLVLRYLVLDTGSWLKHETNLISTHSVLEINFDQKMVKVDIEKSQLEDSPSLAKNKPISQLEEKRIVEYFDWPGYWSEHHASDSEFIHAGLQQRKKLLDIKALDAEKAAEKNAAAEKQSNLRSLEEVTGYKIHAQDEKFGHLEDIFVDEENWLIRYFLIDTKDHIPGKSVLIAPEWIDSISWQGAEIFVDKDKKEIENAPEYEQPADQKLISRGYEDLLYDHYNHHKYWL
ncbi:PRC-barrel domain-containing protein [Halanaerobium praevalens]|uniref:PRC-barrel domain protein n=1 Tax=Halanaerobium praevalens (strain ATCC 33744 / DSM 2228 / GSL) TaxID=572479 RepID=E3DR33_HALPG|nr:PRC-barrel domain-containing protein [Halanaerobium praevalens]ADO78022.1 PRC-barrel domain protein [Halanaerobium praevalens DSM 2228]